MYGTPKGPLLGDIAYGTPKRPISVTLLADNFIAHTSTWAWTQIVLIVVVLTEDARYKDKVSRP